MNSASTGSELYLDLLKKILTNTLHATEPDVDEIQERFVIQFLHHYIQGPAISMLPRCRLDNLQACLTDVIARNIPGDCIETGVWRGGAAIFMRAVLRTYNEADRLVWVADSFEGLPEPDAERFPREAKAYHGAMMRKAFDHLAASLEEVQANFKAFGLLDDNVRFLKGWFKDTLPKAPIERLAVMRLDGDYYESTMDALTNLYDKVSIGGYVIIDDYGEDSWTYCRQAVDEFRKLRGISDPMVQVDRPCFFWRRSA
ncbi:MAG: macrocin O-methyltransferase [Candidatus Meridianibacter frigidus]|nr:MAG: macrocin O-methyltransferase [Candidatus Eremiobacteraeota bacterium]